MSKRKAEAEPQGRPAARARLDNHTFFFSPPWCIKMPAHYVTLRHRGTWVYQGVYPADSTLTAGLMENFFPSGHDPTGVFDVEDLEPHIDNNNTLRKMRRAVQKWDRESALSVVVHKTELNISEPRMAWMSVRLGSEHNPRQPYPDAPCSTQLVEGDAHSDECESSSSEDDFVVHPLIDDEAEEASESDDESWE